MKKINRKNILLVFIVCSICVVLYICTKCGMFTNCTPQSLKNYICSFGAIAPVIYIFMFTVVPLTLFPDAVLALTGGLIFGVWFGTIYTVIGAACGGTLSFLISRLYGRGLVEKLTKGKIKWFDDGTQEKGFIFILILRFIPLIPFDIISYGAGLSKIKYRDFILATIIGVIPGVWVYTNLGDKSAHLFSIDFFKAVAILILLMLVSYFIKKRFTFKTLENKIAKD
jgi:uncharacterized membrane protein YdjX (TVP38/TMEM64 family)